MNVSKAIFLSAFAVSLLIILAGMVAGSPISFGAWMISVFLFALGAFL